MMERKQPEAKEEKGCHKEIMRRMREGYAGRRGGIASGDEIMSTLQKNPRMEENSVVKAIMVEAGVPYSLCRFVTDLLEGSDNGGVFCSEHSFSSFADVLADLKQMIDYPDAFIHLSVTDQWKLAFSEKLYGRLEETKILMDAAERVTKVYENPIFGIPGLNNKKTEV